MVNDTTSDEQSPLLRGDTISAPAENGHDQLAGAGDAPLKPSIRASPTPLPLLNVALVMSVAAMTPIVFELVFPFLNQMILEVGIVTDPEQVGFYSGIIESVFSLTSFLAVMPGSRLSDRIGRKPIILGGTLFMAISTVTFGFSKTLSSMILSRCVGGAAGSVWVSAKTVMAESTDKSNQGKAFQLFTIAYRTGQIVGLPLGGLLAHPERNFSLFRTKFWIEYPFVLPCFVAAGFAVFVVILGFFFLEETLPAKRRTVSRLRNSSELLEIASDHSADSALPIKSVLTPPIISLLVSIVAMCWASEAIFSLYPLYSFTPVSSGGLGMSEAAIGIQMALRSFIHLGIMPFYGTLERRFGSAMNLYRFSMCLWPVIIIYMPLLNVLARIFGSNSWAVNIALVAFYVLWGLCCFAWTCVSIMVTDASPSAKALSTVNSLSQMATLLPQAVAPAFATALFALSIKSEIVGGNMIWLVLLIFTCGGAIQSMSLKEPTSNWRNQ